MRRIARVTLVVAACSLGATAAASAGGADKVLLCHGTASEKNPYVLINVGENALAGHFDGTAPGHGKNNHPDYLLPAGADDCSDVPVGDDGGDGDGGGNDGEF
ncbi:MAG TPA: hypothetical protein VH572_00300 [Gaiella sp.]|jgi:hypothetical protein